MSRSPAQVRLTAEEEATLREWTRKATSEQRLVDRARIILLAHEGFTVEKIAARLQTRPARVSKWRQRFMAGRLSALSDAPRSGKPHKYTADTQQRVLALLDQPAPDGYAQWNGTLIVPLILGRMINGATSWSAEGMGGTRTLGAMFCSENETLPPVGVQVVLPSGIVTLSEPVSWVPVRVGSATFGPPRTGGFVTAVYTTTVPPSESAVT